MRVVRPAGFAASIPSPQSVDSDVHLALVACRGSVTVSIAGQTLTNEVEAKFRIADPADLRARLGQLGATPVSSVLEVNRLFDTPDRRLFSSDCGLRVRAWRSLDKTGESGALLTFKGPRAAGEFKQREELESAVTDAATIAALLDRLGFQEQIRFEKRRQTWTFPPASDHARAIVVIDELPQLGWFAEVEAPTPAAVSAACAALLLSPSDALQDTYVHLAAQHGTEQAGLRTLAF